MSDPDMNAVDRLLAQTADVRPEVPDPLMAAVLRDAVDVQRAMRLRPQKGLWATVLDLIGGWPAISGLAAAGITGIWIGVAPPIGLEYVAADLIGSTEQVDLLGVDPLIQFAVDEES